MSTFSRDEERRSWVSERAARRARRAYIAAANEELIRAGRALRSALLVSDDEQARIAREIAATLRGVADALDHGATTSTKGTNQ